MYLSDIYTIAINLAGVLPCQFPPICSGYAVGLQIIGNYFAEDSLLNIAYQYQQVKIGINIPQRFWVRR